MTIPLPHLLTFAVMALVCLLSWAVQKCEAYRGLVDWLRREFGDD